MGILSYSLLMPNYLMPRLVWQFLVSYHMICDFSNSARLKNATLPLAPQLLFFEHINRKNSFNDFILFPGTHFN